MSKSNVLSGMFTVALLATIAVLLTWGPNTKEVSTTAQIQPTEKHNTASLQRFSLSDMVEKSDRIFRGTVTDLEPGKVSAGGAEFPTVTYRFRVDESFKGNYLTKGDTKYAEITMLGNIKKVNDTNGNIKRLSSLPTPPALQIGSDYLMLMTKESSIGLSSPMGLGQGSFEIYKLEKEEVAKNDYNNAGLFDGPVAYSTLADKIRKGGK